MLARAARDGLAALGVLGGSAAKWTNVVWPIKSRQTNKPTNTHYSFIGIDVSMHERLMIATGISEKSLMYEENCKSRRNSPKIRVYFLSVAIGWLENSTKQKMNTNTLVLLTTDRPKGTRRFKNTEFIT